MAHWTRAEVLIALNLYSRLSFGQFHGRQPLIQQVAARLGRTPDALAMKLGNLASLDPAIVASGRVGLAKASKLDRELWQAFHADSEQIGLESEQALHALAPDFADSHPEPAESLAWALREPAADYAPSASANITVRQGQQFFRRALLVSYRSRCCLTGLDEPQLLVASHIKPWALDSRQRLNPSNGLLLSSLHDQAFDTGLISFDEQLRLLVSPRLKTNAPNRFLADSLLALEGRPLDLPGRWAPDPALMHWHRQERFARPHAI